MKCWWAPLMKDEKIDLSRVVWLCAVATFLAQSIWSEFRGQPFDWQAFGAGAGAVLAGGGIGTYFHSK